MENRPLPGQVLTITHRASWDPGGFPEPQIARIASTSPKQTIVCCHKLLGIASNWQLRKLHESAEHRYDCCWAQLAADGLLELQPLPARASWDPGGLMMQEGEIIDFMLLDYHLIVINLYLVLRQMDNSPFTTFLLFFLWGM